MTKQPANTEEELAALRAMAARFPKLPGVYVMRTGDAEVIYVGKAKELRSRVRSYFLGTDSRHQIEFLMRRVATIEPIVTANEQQAFVLERDLITKYKPRYNIRLKDDKAFLSIRIDLDAEWPRLELVRKVQPDGARYYGPYSFSYELRTLLDVIKRSIPLRTCADTVFHNRARPCLEYQIKRCAGPCCLPVEPALYKGWVKDAIAILEGRTKDLAKKFAAEMERASEELRFEDAAALRDRLTVIESTGQANKMISDQADDKDVFALHRDAGYTTMSVLRMRNGRMAETVNFALDATPLSSLELLESVIPQFYEGGREVPGEIVVPEALESGAVIAEMLAAKRGAKVEILAPERGLRARLLGLAQLNAQQHFEFKYSAETRYGNTATTIQKELGLKQAPRRIECIDISNFHGSDIVGAVTCFFDGEPKTSAYRRYIISKQGKADDFASVREVVLRRLARGEREQALPDLLIIDGGAAQLEQALAARDELNLSVEIVSLAKERTEANAQASEIVSSLERVYVDPRKEPISLKEGSDLFQLFTRIRNETHRFVITFHRERRGKRVFSSKLDSILGVGPDKRKRLLTAFGSIEEIAKQDAETVAKTGRMPLPLAEKVLRVLRSTE